MILSTSEEAMLSGKRGKAVQQSMEIITALGNIFSASKLIDVKSVQVAGVSYHNLGDAGIEYLENLAIDGKIASGVKATLNPAGMDLKKWQKMGIGYDFATKQNRIIGAFERMGVSITCTCTPYLIGNIPSFGEHIAWSESSAVCYANSVLGARTNREGGPSSLASALTGKTAEYGFHLDNNRKAQIAVDVKADLKTSADFSALGHAIAEKAKNRVLLIRGIKKTSQEQLKSFCASTATYGGTALFHVEKITPEWKKAGIPKEKIEISKADIRKSYEFLNDNCKPDFIAMGCPHCSIEELVKISTLLRGKKVKMDTWICVSRAVAEFAQTRGLIKEIEKSGASVFADTCMAVSPLKGRFKCLATNSAKACFYGRGSNNFKTRLCSTEECIEFAIGNPKRKKK